MNTVVYLNTQHIFTPQIYIEAILESVEGLFVKNGYEKHLAGIQLDKHGAKMAMEALHKHREVYDDVLSDIGERCNEIVYDTTNADLDNFYYELNRLIRASTSRLIFIHNDFHVPTGVINCVKKTGSVYTLVLTRASSTNEKKSLFNVDTNSVYEDIATKCLELFLENNPYLVDINKEKETTEQNE